MQSQLLVSFVVFLFVAIDSTVDGHYYYQYQRSNAQVYRLRRGRVLPQIGYSSENCGPNIQCLNCLINAIEAGFRFIETAHIYNNRRELSMAIRESIRAKRVNRSDLFILDKVWNTHHRSVDVVTQIKYHLKDLGIKKLDAAILHWPTSFKKPQWRREANSPYRNYPRFDNGSFIPLKWVKDRTYVNAYRGLEAARKLNMVGYIGIANFNVNQIRTVLKYADVRPTFYQGVCDATYQNRKVVEYARSQGLIVLCERPFNRTNAELVTGPEITEVASIARITPLQASVRWIIEEGNIPLVIPGYRDQLYELLDTLNIQLDSALRRRISETRQLPRIEEMPGLETHPDYPFGPDA